MISVKVVVYLILAQKGEGNGKDLKFVSLGNDRQISVQNLIIIKSKL